MERLKEDFLQKIASLYNARVDLKSFGLSDCQILRVYPWLESEGDRQEEERQRQLSELVDSYNLVSTIKIKCVHIHWIDG